MTEINNKSLNKSQISEYPWHQKCWEQFTKAKLSNHLPHAILLSGEESIAKLALARRMAKSLICINTVNQETDACNNCQSCKTYESGANPDFIQIGLLEDKQQIGVDQIRALSEFLNYSRSYNTYRVVIINPVERMNLNAANSLLKSLEEPTSNTVLILVTSKASQLLPTIKSRCQLFSVTSPNKTESIDWINQNIDFEKQFPTTDIEGLLDIIGNKPLKVINFNQDEIENRNKFFQDLSASIQQQITITEMAKKWEKYDLDIILNWQVSLLQATIKSVLCNTQSQRENSKRNNSLTQHLSIEQHWHLYQNLIKQKQYIHTSVNSLMFMENMILLWK